MIFYAICLFALWSTSFVLNKSMVSLAEPLFLIAFRMSFSGFLILLFWLLKRRSFSLSKLQMGYAVLISFIGVFGSNLLESLSLIYLSCAKTCFIYSLTPFWTALLSIWLFQEFIDTKKALGLCLGILGTVPVMITQTGVEDLTSLQNFFTWPTLAAIGATLCSALGATLFTKALRTSRPPSPTLLNGITMLAGGGYALLTSLMWESWLPLPCQVHNMVQVCFNTILLSLLSNIVCYNIYGWLLKYLTTTFLSLIGLLSPLFTAFWEWCFFGTPPSLIIIFSVPLICLALFLCYQSELQSGYLPLTWKTARQPHTSSSKDHT